MGIRRSIGRSANAGGSGSGGTDGGEFTFWKDRFGCMQGSTVFLRLVSS